MEQQGIPRWIGGYKSSLYRRRSVIEHEDRRHAFNHGVRSAPKVTPSIQGAKIPRSRYRVDLNNRKRDKSSVHVRDVP